jgi:hypothetical protein
LGKKVKYSANFDRDWAFYTQNVSKLSFWGGDPIFKPQLDPNGIPAKEFFFKLDSTGMKKMQSVGCSEPDLVADVLKFKKALNFHIKMWSEGFEDVGQGVAEYMATFDDPPDWVEVSFRNQLLKIHKDKVVKDVNSSYEVLNGIIDNAPADVPTMGADFQAGQNIQVSPSTTSGTGSET